MEWVLCRKSVVLWLSHWGWTKPMRLPIRLRSATVRKISCACTHYTVCGTALSHSCLLLSRFTSAGSDWDRCLPARLPACMCSCPVPATTTTTSLFPTPYPSSSEGYEKSRRLNNVAGIVANTLRLSPVTSPYGSPCPPRRSPIPSILWAARPPLTNHSRLILHRNF